MVKATPFTPKPALDKLPLAARKDISDNFEANVEDFRARIKALLGTDFTFNINAEEVWAYAEEGQTSAGTCFAGYVEGFISALEYFINKYHEAGKTYFNAAVSQSALTLTVNPLGEKGKTISSDVKDGVYRILFRPGELGYNQTQQYDNILPAIESAPRDGFSLSAKHSIDTDYEGEIDAVQQAISELCGTQFALDPNFEENYRVLAGAKETAKNDKDWELRVGSVSLKYFKGLEFQLERQGFRDDDMIHEGLQEVVKSKTFKIRVVPETSTKRSSETVVDREQGVVYLQCTPKKWGLNPMDMGEDFLRLL
ncbi:hypothetical protein MVEN_00975900 [Mycena venus]|uniref:Uncharacterized protein n=1 Tax=Mycena venus TaxID=2733690 RepID=A0A8H6Y8R8_9AGAR|nr:hypothetical protein MVEN_00975900 [Mycena venus]